MKTAIIVDSTAYIPKSLREEKNIYSIPLSIIFNDKQYREEENITAEEFYEKVKQEKIFPTTSQPPIGEIVELLKEIAVDYDEAVFITLSSGISGTYQTVQSAGRMVEGLTVYPYDSEISCMVEGFYALEGADMAARGKSATEIVKRFDEMKPFIRAYFIVDDLSHLQRGGRLSAAQALIGSVLQVKPILHFEDTKIVPFEKIRTRKKALKRVLELFHEDAFQGVPIEATVIHANRLQEAEELCKEIENKYPNVNVNISYFGPVIGTHLGEGALGLGWYRK
ncbi:DegV family protein [Priestia endophytica]|uniref:Fatty acid-binding protein DegV n=2 Tax=Priestia endophytica TaxID=135735 RepID=A0AAX1Q5T5_9BACI|nr:DegV family protein [Priestia endophytica]KAB2490571.1 DegV family protein [Priestia endophytica]KYG28497.1 fatty acid-binding protein DegV [Priestia endophytica]MCM3540247.1 DegV family protein [Priestia endophytica]MED4071358.1 DegV family protein [Priestia endophytica]RAS74856.1 fatty acid-binding protein DegV [Priestia endophytica]